MSVWKRSRLVAAEEAPQVEERKVLGMIRRKVLARCHELVGILFGHPIFNAVALPNSRPSERSRADHLMRRPSRSRRFRCARASGTSRNRSMVRRTRIGAVAGTVSMAR